MGNGQEMGETNFEVDGEGYLISNFGSVIIHSYYIYNWEFKRAMLQNQETGTNMRSCAQLPALARNMGCWSSEEQQKYIQKSLQSRHQRKNTKIFKMMADFVVTRDGIQCRSHHIKQMKTHKQIRRSTCQFNLENRALTTSSFASEVQVENFIPLPQTEVEYEQTGLLHASVSFNSPVGSLFAQNQTLYQFFSQIPFAYPACVPLVFVHGVYPSELAHESGSLL